jgi:hypothetical protein
LPILPYFNALARLFDENVGLRGRAFGMKLFFLFVMFVNDLLPFHLRMCQIIKKLETICRDVFQLFLASKMFTKFTNFIRA